MSKLTLKNVEYIYPNAKNSTLKNINIDFKEGKVYVIMGKSGAGKTTLLSLISGLDTTTSGTILYDGNDLKKLNRDNYRAKSVGVVFQGYNLLTNATAVENVVLSMNISQVDIKDKKEYAYKLLEDVNINREKANRKVLKLSGGEQQRVAIARAISNKSDILIADEPTGNLDKETETSIMNILQKIAHENNKCVIVVTHSNSVSKYADELWGINNGNLVFVKEKEAI